MSHPYFLRNIALMAHIDAGKTTLAERFLYFGNAISGIGEVDDALSTMDFLEEEQKRGITIESGYASYYWKNHKINLVDTPGHIDFGAEVDGALAGVEGVVLIISGVNGVESQTQAAWQKICAHKVRPILFVNKHDLPGLSLSKLLSNIKGAFKANPLLMNIPVIRSGKLIGVLDIIVGKTIYVDPANPKKLISETKIPPGMESSLELNRQALIDASSQYNDEIIKLHLAGSPIPPALLIKGLAKAFATGTYLPVYCGSALANIGIRAVLNAINVFVPSPEALFYGRGVLRVLKRAYNKELGPVIIARLYSALSIQNDNISTIFQVNADEYNFISTAESGEIVGIQLDSGLPGIRPGDILNSAMHVELKSSANYKPLLQVRLEPEAEGDQNLIKTALDKLIWLDPSLSIEENYNGEGWLISTVGEVQLEIFLEKLKKESHCELRVGKPQVRYIERLKKDIKDMKNCLKQGGFEIEIGLDAFSAEGSENTLIIFDDPEIRHLQDGLQSIFTQFCQGGIAGKGPLEGLVIKINTLISKPTCTLMPLLSKAFQDCLHLNITRNLIGVFEPIMSLQALIPNEFVGSIVKNIMAKGGEVKEISSEGFRATILFKIPLNSIFGYTTLLRSLSKGQGEYVLSFEEYSLIK